MRKLYALLIVLVMSPSFMAMAQYTEEEQLLIDQAINFSDNGQEKKAISIYKKLLKKHPSDGSLMYEMAYSYYHMANYTKAIEVLEKGEKLDDAEGIMYAIHGNSLDILGKPDEALAKYQEGIERFPECGQLYLESGIIYSMRKDYMNAIDFWSRGIEAEPDFPSNYFRLAQILCCTNEPVYGIIYGETFELMQPATERADELSWRIYEAYADNITMPSDSSIRYHLTDKEIYDAGPGGPKFNFEAMYEFFLARPEDFDILKEKGRLGILDLAQNRKKFLETFFADGNNSKDLLPVFKYQQKVIAAGHWDAYNMFIMREGDEAAFREWVDANEEAFDAFLKWFCADENQFDPING